MSVEYINAGNLLIGLTTGWNSLGIIYTTLELYSQKKVLLTR